MFNETVMDHFQNPRNAGELADADAVGSVGDPTCGDVTKVYLKVVDGKVADIRYKTFGCAAAIASSSIATEMVKNKTLEEAASITSEDIVDALHGLPPEKIHCSRLAANAIRAAVEKYRADS
ncbi:MAG: iron-sulfur cluster assembly scaffold protein [candidate division Zixibacteria bacterium]|nr:iron-sulfur cluster assembly scaffold protein [candidate division Zixibacteria bacterium]